MKNHNSYGYSFLTKVFMSLFRTEGEFYVAIWGRLFPDVVKGERTMSSVFKFISNEENVF